MTLDSVHRQWPVIAIAEELICAAQNVSERARSCASAVERGPADYARALSLDGRMIDRPHLVQAQRTLTAAEE